MAMTCVEGEQVHAAMMTSCKHATSSTDDVLGDGDEGEWADASVDRSVDISAGMRGEHAAS